MQEGKFSLAIMFLIMRFCHSTKVAKNISSEFGVGGGLVSSMLAFFSDDPSSNLSDKAKCLFCTILFGKKEKGYII